MLLLYLPHSHVISDYSIMFLNLIVIIASDFCSYSHFSFLSLIYQYFRQVSVNDGCGGVWARVCVYSSLLIASQFFFLGSVSFFLKW